MHFRLFPDDESDMKNLQIVFATAKGKVRKNSLEDFSSINSAGKIAIKLDPNDKIVGVEICKDDQDVMLSTKNGKCIRFESKKLRIFKGRSSKGIKGIELSPNDEIVSLSIANKEKTKKDSKSEERFVLSIIGKIDTPVTVPRAEPPVRRARVFGTSRGEILRRPRRVPRVTRAVIVVRNLPMRSEPPTRAWTLVHVVIIPPPGFHPVRRSLPEHLWLSPCLPDPVKHRRPHHAQASPLRHRQRRIEQETRNHHGDELPERHH